MRHKARAQMTAWFIFQEQPWSSHLGFPHLLTDMDQCLLHTWHDVGALWSSSSFPQQSEVGVWFPFHSQGSWGGPDPGWPAMYWTPSGSALATATGLMFSHSHIRLRCQGASIWLIGCGVAGFQGSPAPPPACPHSAGPAVLFRACPHALSHWGPAHVSTQTPSTVPHTPALATNLWTEWVTPQATIWTQYFLPASFGLLHCHSFVLSKPYTW